MTTEYCNKCGLLHDSNDGECLGCEMQKEIKVLKTKIDRAVEMLNSGGQFIDIIKWARTILTEKTKE
jgi:hypothetical protein